jgi:hypothetical protein
MVAWLTSSPAPCGKAVLRHPQRGQSLSTQRWAVIGAPARAKAPAERSATGRWQVGGRSVAARDRLLPPTERKTHGCRCVKRHLLEKDDRFIGQNRTTWRSRVPQLAIFRTVHGRDRDTQSPDARPAQLGRVDSDAREAHTNTMPDETSRASERSRRELRPDRQSLPALHAPALPLLLAEGYAALAKGREHVQFLEHGWPICRP